MIPEPLSITIAADDSAMNIFKKVFFYSFAKINFSNFLQKKMIALILTGFCLCESGIGLLLRCCKLDSTVNTKLSKKVRDKSSLNFSVHFSDHFLLFLRRSTQPLLRKYSRTSPVLTTLPWEQRIGLSSCLHSPKSHHEDGLVIYTLAHTDHFYYSAMQNLASQQVLHIRKIHLACDILH
jgi:hypothetical protein